MMPTRSASGPDAPSTPPAIRATLARVALVGALAVALVAGPVAGVATGTTRADGPGSAGARPGTAAAVRADVPLPVVEPVTGPTSPMTAALQDLRKAGYVEREFRVTLTDPQLYAYTGTGTEVSATPAPTSPQGAYRTRIIVRQPADRARFTGRVLVEMMNTTAQLDLDIAWQQAHRHLLRAGWAYVGITVQQTGINALQAFKRDPKRYPDLGLNLRVPAAATAGLAGFRDPSLAWDLVSQVGTLLRSEDPSNPLAGIGSRRLLLTGQSQMAGYAVTYVNAIQPRDRVYDGVLVVSRSARATSLGFAAEPTSTSPEQLTIDGQGTPVLDLQTETDLTPDPVVRRPDADQATDRFRLWEVPGSAHNDEWAARQALALVARDFPLTLPTGCDWTPPTAVTSFPVRYVWHAALDRLDRWAAGGAAPPAAPRVALAGTGAVLRDRDGNARGGLRISPIEVPIAAYAPSSPGGLFCTLTGAQTPFGPGKLVSRYATTKAYVARVARSTAADVRTGFLLSADAAELVAAARRVAIGRR